VSVAELSWIADARDARVRRPHFTPRIPFAPEAIAAVALAIERRACELLATPLRVDLFPPLLREGEDWGPHCEDARVYAVASERIAAALLCSPRAARRIVACAFAEERDSAHALSALEVRVLDRFIAGLVSSLEPVCGGPSLCAARAMRPSSRFVYCEVRLSAPVDASLGIVLDEPAPNVGDVLSPAALDDCPIECSVRLGVAAVDIFTISALAVGDVVRLESKVGASATLNLGADVIASGEGGVLGERGAFKVHHLCV
jgi:flagellar motor switch/type III secretory pathway protein FliN